MNDREARRYMQVARRVAEQSRCGRRHVGAILIRRDELVGSGANVPPPGSPGCDELGICFESGGPCETNVHAAVSLILATTPTERSGATVVMTICPCISCAMMLVSSGITELIYDAPYRVDEQDAVTAIFAAAGIELTQLRS